MSISQNHIIQQRQMVGDKDRTWVQKALCIISGVNLLCMVDLEQVGLIFKCCPSGTFHISCYPRGAEEERLRIYETETLGIEERGPESISYCFAPKCVFSSTDGNRYVFPLRKCLNCFGI